MKAKSPQFFISLPGRYRLADVVGSLNSDLLSCRVSCKATHNICTGGEPAMKPAATLPCSSAFGYLART